MCCLRSCVPRTAVAVGRVGIAATFACSYPRHAQAVGMAAILLAYTLVRHKLWVWQRFCLLIPSSDASCGYSSHFCLLIPLSDTSCGYGSHFCLLIPSPCASCGYGSHVCLPIPLSDASCGYGSDFACLYPCHA